MIPRANFGTRIVTLVPASGAVSTTRPYSSPKAVRSAWAIIAPEETEHAELSHALHRWLMSQLSEGDRRKVDATLRETLQALEAELALEPDAELVSGAGVPDAAQARRLYEGLEQALFSTLLEQSAA